MQLARHMILWQVSDKETTFMKTTEVTSVGNKKTPLYTKFQKSLWPYLDENSAQCRKS
jgi:hypothetical protein